MTYKIQKEIQIDSKDIQVLTDGISDYAKLKKNHALMEAFAFFVRDKNSRIYPLHLKMRTMANVRFENYQ